MKRFLSFLLLLSSFACDSPTEKQANEVLETLEVKDSAYRDISADTVIFQAQKYFTDKNDLPKAALAAFYSGRVRQQRGQFDEAMAAYVSAEILAQKIEDYKLLGKVYFYTGVMYGDQLFSTQCIDKMQMAAELVRKYTNDYRWEAAIYNFIGNVYFLENKEDSCLAYYNRAMHLAESYSDSLNLSSISENLSVFYQKKKDWNNAKKSIQKSIHFNRNESARLYFNLAKVFHEENIRDSVNHCMDISLELAEKENNHSLMSTIYRFLSQTEVKEGNYKQALSYQDQYTYYLSQVITERGNNEILVVEKKYKYEQVQNRNKQLLIERQRIYIGVLSLVLLVLAVCYYFYWKITSQKLSMISMEKSFLSVSQEIQAMEKMVAGYNEQEESLRTAVLSHFDITKKVALLKSDDQLNDRSNYKRSPLERINKILYGTGKKEYDWDTFFKSASANTLYKPTLDIINLKLPVLNNMERHICYLTCMDFSNAEISLLLDCSLSTVEHKKACIREKMNLPDRTNIKAYIGLN
ncbi:MAG: hypothetical protein LBH19_15305 [Dysgonamonadaceae bacterium]|jgi:tetratricopeptide (TPR) repeat protein/DNA-binding CsgD family transcriptional regulator|nr:hypothetical protein [Dysgonamonadaceae bacterium]